MASIRNVMICTGVLLLAAHYSIGNPVPRHRRSDERCGQNQASESTCTELWTIDTNSTEDSVTQITNGISVYRQIVTGGPVLSELDQVYRVKEYKLGLQAVCRMHYLYLRYDTALNNTDESNDNYISYTSAKFVAQRAMENACRWVQIVANNHSRNASVRDCTLEDIDAACLDFVRSYELYNITEEIDNYVKESFPGVGIQAGSGSRRDWFNCNLNHSEESLSPEAITHICGKIN